jgi:hypothetical protein
MTWKISLILIYMLSANRNIEMCIKNPIYYIIYLFNNLIKNS